MSRRRSRPSPPRTPDHPSPFSFIRVVVPPLFRMAGPHRGLRPAGATADNTATRIRPFRAPSSRRRIGIVANPPRRLISASSVHCLPRSKPCRSVYPTRAKKPLRVGRTSSRPRTPLIVLQGPYQRPQSPLASADLSGRLSSRARGRDRSPQRRGRASVASSRTVREAQKAEGGREPSPRRRKPCAIEAKRSLGQRRASGPGYPGRGGSEKSVYVGYALRAEMRLPGEAALQFSIEPVGQPEPSRLVQAAPFRPRGLLGLAYWYGVMPLHGIVVPPHARWHPVPGRGRCTRGPACERVWRGWPGRHGRAQPEHSPQHWTKVH